MQFQADVLGIPVLRPQVSETTALGAAWLAGLTCGAYQSTQDVAALWRPERRFDPQMSTDQAASLMSGWDAAVRQALGP
jgi:glycerol kinase